MPNIKKDKEWYKAKARNEAAKAFAGFDPKAYASNAIAKAQMDLKEGDGHVIENFAQGRADSQIMRQMEQAIDGTHISADISVDTELMAAAVYLLKAAKAGVEGAQEQMNRVMDFRLYLKQGDES